MAAGQKNTVVASFAPPIVTSATCYNRILTRLALAFPEWDVYSSHQISALRFVQAVRYNNYMNIG